MVPDTPVAGTLVVTDPVVMEQDAADGAVSLFEHAAIANAAAVDRTVASNTRYFMGRYFSANPVLCDA